MFMKLDWIVTMAITRLFSKTVSPKHIVLNHKVFEFQLKQLAHRLFKKSMYMQALSFFIWDFISKIKHISVSLLKDA